MAIRGDNRKRWVLAAMAGLLFFWPAVWPVAAVTANGPSGEAASIAVLSSSDRETIIEIKLDDFLVDSLAADGRVYHRLKIPDYATTLEVGRPELPVITELVAVPGRAEVAVTVVEAESELRSGYEVYPFQKPLPEGQRRMEFDRDDVFYSSDRSWPERPATAGEPAVWRDVRVVTLRVCPFQYNPAERELRVYRRLVVRLDYADGSDRNVHEYGRRPVTPAYDDIYRRHILNYDYLKLPRGEPDKQDYRLLIITMTKFYQTMLTFHDFKENYCGIETHLKDFYDLDADTPEELRDYIQAEYNDHNMEFVILVGDISDIPIYEGYTYGDEGEHMISDYYYSLLAGSDDFPEVAVGRFSCEYDIEAYNMESKTRSFLARNPANNEWLNKVLLVAHQEGAPGNYEGCKEDIRGRMYAHPPVFDVCYGSTGSTNSDVISRIMDGRGVVNYRGHGSSNCWTSWNSSSESFCKGDVEMILNDTLTPIVLGIACWNNKLDQSSWCLGEKFTLDSMGAVAYLGASRPSYTTPNHDYDKRIFRELFDNEGGFLGNAINAAATSIINNHGSRGEENARMYILLGDPSITYPPVTHPDSTPDTAYVGVVIDTTEAMVGEMETVVGYLVDLIDLIFHIVEELVALLPSPQDPGNPWPAIPPTPDPNGLIGALEDMVDDVYVDTSYINDALCAAIDFIEDVAGDTSSTRIIFATAGGRHDSGQCAGFDDPSAPWDDDPGSWQYNVWNKVMSTGVILDVIYAGDDRDGEAAFLHDLALASGGGWYNPADTSVCGNGIVETGETCEDDADCGATDGGRWTMACNSSCHCVCGFEPGNCNGDGIINILDITYLINYLYKGGPAPVPDGLGSGDASCDCTLNILDVTYLINYLYRMGAPPCGCSAWVEECG